MVKNVVVSVLNREKSIHGAQKQSDFQVKTIGIPTGPIAPQVKQLQVMENLALTNATQEEKHTSGATRRMMVGTTAVLA